jgi:hypothetical protein
MSEILSDCHIRIHARIYVRMFVCQDLLQLVFWSGITRSNNACGHQSQEAEAGGSSGKNITVGKCSAFWRSASSVGGYIMLYRWVMFNLDIYQPVACIHSMMRSSDFPRSKVGYSMGIGGSENGIIHKNPPNRSFTIPCVWCCHVASIILNWRSLCFATFVF